jgi:hypothetical protein
MCVLARAQAMTWPFRQKKEFLSGFWKKKATGFIYSMLTGRRAGSTAPWFGKNERIKI